ncbi:MAG: hypothetical protein HY320_06555, partial [Armatimonadetes bacterium]|nr:hypothetical protein [Armatimonadota bacterium]
MIKKPKHLFPGPSRLMAGLVGLSLCLGGLWASEEKPAAPDVTAQVAPTLRARWKPLPQGKLSAAAAGKVLARAGKMTLRGNQEF